MMKTVKLSELIWFVALVSFTNLFAYAQQQIVKQDGTDLKLTAAEAAKSEKVKNISPEEKLIRWTYRKLTIYELVYKISKAKKEKKPIGQALAQKALRFQLKDFRVGPIEEIQNVRYADLVTKPTGEIIQTGTATATTYDDEETKFSVMAGWTRGQYASGITQDWTISDLLQFEAARFSDVGKYASYEVTVSLDGKKRTYRALVFFHNAYQSSEPLNPEFLDVIVGMGGTITHVFRETKLPVGMRQVTNSIQKAVTNFEQFSNQEDNEEKFSNKFYENGNECMFTIVDFGYCDCIDWEDGVMICTIQPPMPIPGPPPPLPCEEKTSSITTQKVDNDSTNHASGMHGATTKFIFTCQQLASCQTMCSPTFEFAEPYETGTTTEYLYHHVGQKATDTKDGIGYQDAEVICGAGAAYAFSRCLSESCNISLQITLSASGQGIQANVSGKGDLWNTKQVTERKCKNGQ
jgi:hypothetical protein